MDSAIQALNNQGLVISLLKCVLGGQNGLILSGLIYPKSQYKLKNEMLLHEIIWDDVHENKKYCRSMTSCTCKTECNLKKRMCRENNNLQSSIFPCYCNSENHIEYKNILIFIIQCNLDCSILIDWWLHHWQGFVSSVCKTKRSHVTMCPLTNKSQKMSKGLKNIKCQSFVLTTFWNDLRSTEQTYSMQHGSIC